MNSNFETDRLRAIEASLASIEIDRENRKAIRQAERLSQLEAERLELRRIESEFDQLRVDRNARELRQLESDLAQLRAGRNALSSPYADLSGHRAVIAQAERLSRIQFETDTLEREAVELATRLSLNTASVQKSAPRSTGIVMRRSAIVGHTLTGSRVESELSVSENSWTSKDATRHYEKEVRMRVRVSVPPATGAAAPARLALPPARSARPALPPARSARPPSRLMLASRRLALVANPRPVGLLWPAVGNVVPVLGNGDCGANCLALHLMGRDEFSSREELLGYAREAREDITEFYATRAGLYLEKRAEAGVRAMFPESVEDYRAFMLEDGVHFTMVEFYAASQIYGLQIVFVDADSGLISHIIGDYGSPQVFIRYFAEGGYANDRPAGHFDLIRDAIVVVE